MKELEKDINNSLIEFSYWTWNNEEQYNEIKIMWESLSICFFSKIKHEFDNKMVLELFNNHTDLAKRYLSIVGMLENSIFHHDFNSLGILEQLRIYIAFCLSKDIMKIGLELPCLENISELELLGFCLNLQKIQKKHNCCINIACKINNKHMEDYFNAVINYDENNKINIIYRKSHINYLDLLKDKIIFGPCEEADFLKLEKYHYVKSPNITWDYLYGAFLNNIVVGVIVCVSPVRELGNHIINKSPVFQYASQYFMSCIRIIAHPDFRGLSIAKNLLRYASEDIRCHIYEMRSSILKGTTVVSHWGGSIVPREYRKNALAYDMLYSKMLSIGIDIEADYSENYIKNFSINIKNELRILALKRLEEIDSHQWQYYEDLIRQTTEHSEKEYLYARNLYIEAYQKMYEKYPLDTLIEMCKKWESEAYVFKLEKKVGKILK